MTMDSGYCLRSFVELEMLFEEHFYLISGYFYLFDRLTVCSNSYLLVNSVYLYQNYQLLVAVVADYSTSDLDHHDSYLALLMHSYVIYLDQHQILKLGSHHFDE